MKGSTHLALGAALGVAIGSQAAQYTGSLPLGIISATACIAGSLFPDIDIQGSRISRRAKLLSKTASFAFGHRGFLHSPLFLVVFSAVLWTFLPCYVILGFCVGFISHLVLDLLNPAGIPLLFPYKKRYSILKIPSGAKIQSLFVILLWLFSAAEVIGLMPI